MRAIWKGAVSFGLVNVPVRLYSATENHDVQFRQVHREDGGRIKYKRTCSIDGEEVSYDDIAKGYETEDGDMVVLTDEDFADLPSKTSKEIGVTKFVPADQIDPMWLDKSYYLEPDKSATKPYVLLREALEIEKRVAIVTVSIRTRMTMAVLRVRDGVIVMQTMLWPDEVRAADFAHVDEEQQATKQEMDMAKMLIDQLAGDYDPERVRGRLRARRQGARPGQGRGRRGAGGRGRGGGVRRGRRPARGPLAVGREGQGRPGRGALEREEAGGEDGRRRPRKKARGEEEQREEDVLREGARRRRPADPGPPRRAGRRGAARRLDRRSAGSPTWARMGGPARGRTVRRGVVVRRTPRDFLPSIGPAPRPVGPGDTEGR